VIKYIRGNLLDTDASYILHGCNCQGVMGSGVALQIKEKFPEAYSYYKEKYRFGDLSLGDVHQIACCSPIIFNCMTQEYYGNNKKFIYANYEAIRKCLRLISKLIPFTHLKIAMPKIGCGLANGDWNIVSKIVEEELGDFEVLVYEL
jgi:O-acetyl-ADP-ribose deacetylase (regulator of RNase III)